MRYYTVKALINSSDEETRDMRGFDSLDEAKVKFHSDLSNAIGKETTKSVMLMIVNEVGGVHATESWVASAE